MTIALILSTIISTLIYTKIYFKDYIEMLHSSYKKTLTSQNKIEFNPIKESLFQMKILLSILLRIIFILIPFIFLAIYIILTKNSLQLVFYNLLNNILIIIFFILTSLILKHEKK